MTVVSTDELRGRGRPSLQGEIENWLLGILAAGSLQANTIYQSGKLRGYSPRTLQRIKKTLGIERIQKNRAWYWRDPQVPEASDTKPKNAIEKLSQQVAEIGRAVQVPRVITEDGVASVQRNQVDNLGYSKDTPQGVMPQMTPLAIISRIGELENNGLDHDEIAKQVHDWAYPASGLSESTVMSFLKSNGITVRPKSDLFPANTTADVYF